MREDPATKQLKSLMAKSGDSVRPAVASPESSPAPIPSVARSPEPDPTAVPTPVASRVQETAADCIAGVGVEDVMRTRSISPYLEFRLESGQDYRLALSDRIRFLARWESGDGVLKVRPLGPETPERSTSTPSGDETSFRACPYGSVMAGEIPASPTGIAVQCLGAAGTAVKVYLVK